MRQFLLPLLLLFLFSSVALAQKRAVTGRITSYETGESMPGVTVLIKGTTQGTVTDTSGTYSIMADNQSILVYSFIGCTTDEVVVGEQTTIDVVLLPDISSLQEIVVVGYGTQKRSQLTGSIGSISPKEVKSMPVNTLDQFLQGRVAGVQVIQNSSAPGGAISVLVRGGNSLTGGNAPLYVIDGFPVYSNDKEANAGRAFDIGQPQNALSAINPNDIESIEILKDASATSIFGARGANGVVLITTKRGKIGEPRVEFESYFGLQEVVRKIPLLNAAQYATLVNEANVNDGKSPVFSNPDSLGRGTDWQDQIFRVAPVLNYHLSISGGDENTRYAITGNYFSQDGIVKNSGFKRYAFRSNLDRRVTQKINIGQTLTISRTFGDRVITDTGGGTSAGVINAALIFSPIKPVRDEKGDYSKNDTPGGAAIDNPVALTEVVNEIITTRALGGVFADYAIHKNLTFKISLGADITYTKENTFLPTTVQQGANVNGSATVGVVQNTTWLNENTLTYHKLFNDRHDLTALAGYTMQSSKLERIAAGSYNFFSDQLQYNNLNLGNPYVPLSGARKWSLNSYLGRVNYAFDNKYLLAATLRADGSSRLGNNNKYGLFPSAAAAWRLSEEGFMKNLGVISDLKIRTSYGLSGNQEIAEYQSLATLAGQNYVFGGRGYRGVGPSRIGNPDLKWETTGQFDAGLDVGLLQDRVALTADYYYKKTTDLLLEADIPYTSGYQKVLKNAGSNENRGIELALYTYNLVKKVKWNTSFNISANRNKVLSLGQVEEFSAGRGSTALQVPTTGIVRVGQPVGLFYGLVSDGIFQDEEQIASSAQPNAKPGDIRFKDLDEDGVINENDKTVIGKAQPKFIYGLSNNFSYQGFELNVFLQGVYGSRILNMNRLELESLTGANNQSTSVLNRWTADQPGNTLPRATTANTYQISDRQVEDGSYLRLRNISLSYNLPEGFLTGKFLKTAKVYISAQNLWTLTRYTGYDPEVNSFANYSLTLGTDYGSYPNAKTYRMGVNISF